MSRGEKSRGTYEARDSMREGKKILKKIKNLLTNFQKDDIIKPSKGDELPTKT